MPTYRITTMNKGKSVLTSMEHPVINKVIVIGGGYSDDYVYACMCCLCIENVCEHCCVQWV